MSTIGGQKASPHRLTFETIVHSKIPSATLKCRPKLQGVFIQKTQGLLFMHIKPFFLKVLQFFETNMLAPKMLGYFMSNRFKIQSTKVKSIQEF